MSRLDLSEKATLDGVSLEGVDSLSLENCEPACWAKLPATVKELSISFYCTDARHIPWKRLPASMSTMFVTRSSLAEPADCQHLTNLNFLSIHISNLRDIRPLLTLPALKSFKVEYSPLEPESIAAMKAQKKAHPEFKLGKVNDIELTRRLYDVGIEIAALWKGTKKIQLQVPYAPVCQDFPRELVEAAIATHVSKKQSLKGQAFIDHVRKLDADARAAARAAKKAAKAAAKG
jgi:Leucine-rich repeat (LRR) protein